MIGVACPIYSGQNLAGKLQKDGILTAKLFSQFDEAPMEIAFARTPRGNTSDTSTHAPGYTVPRLASAQSQVIEAVLTPQE